MCSDRHVADAESDFYVFNINPDFCRVNGCIRSFNIAQTLVPEFADYSTKVFARGKKTLPLDSIIRGVKGNAGQGVWSTVSQGDGNIKVKTGSTAVRIQGRLAARDGDLCDMNCKADAENITSVSRPMIEVSGEAKQRLVVVDIPVEINKTIGRIQTVQLPDSEPRRLPKIINQTNDPAAEQKVMNELDKLPNSVVTALADAKTKIMIVADNVGQANLAHVMPQGHPRGWDDGKTYSDLPGLYDPDDQNTVIIAADADTPKVPTVAGVPQEGKPPEPRHGSSDMILHELGHAYDKAMHYLSKKKGFVVAYKTVPKEELSKYYIQPKDPTNNPLEPSDDGRSEAFAETFARFYGGQPPQPGTHTPEMDLWWEKNP
jgi:hypothetical protein